MKIKLFEEFSTFNLEEVASGLCAELSDILNEDLDFKIIKEENFIKIESVNVLEDDLNTKEIDKLVKEYRILYPEIKDWYIEYFIDTEYKKFKCIILEGTWIKNLLNSLVKSDKKVEGEFWNRGTIFVTPENHWIIYQDKKYEHFWCSYYNFCIFFESKYSLEHSETEGFLKGILNRHFKTEGYMPTVQGNIVIATLNRHFKTEGYTPLSESLVYLSFPE